MQTIPLVYADNSGVSCRRNFCIVLVKLLFRLAETPVSCWWNFLFQQEETLVSCWWNFFFLADNTDEMNRQIRVIGRTDVPERRDIKKTARGQLEVCVPLLFWIRVCNPTGQGQTTSSFPPVLRFRVCTDTCSSYILSSC